MQYPEYKWLQHQPQIVHPFFYFTDFVWKILLLTIGSLSTAEEGSEDGRSIDDVKLIASLKNKIKVLKKAYLEEHEKAVSYQQQFESLLPKAKSLEEALAEKETLCAKLNSELLSLKDAVIAAQAKGSSSPGKIGKGRTAAELEQLLEAATKENDDLKEQMQQLKDSLSTNEHTLTHMKNYFTEQIQDLTKKYETQQTKLEATEKERTELKASCEQYEVQSKITFDQRSYPSFLFSSQQKRTKKHVGN